MASLITILSVALFIGNLICWIMEIIAAFKNEEKPILGIVSIVPCLNLGGFIVGWIKHKEWGITKLMTIWSVLFVANIILNIIAVASGAGAGAIPGGAGAIPIPGGG